MEKSRKTKIQKHKKLQYPASVSEECDHRLSDNIYLYQAN